MKKILSIFVLFFAMSASAQTEKKELSPAEKVKVNVADLTSVMGVMDSDLNNAITQLFEIKHKMLSKNDISEAERNEVSSIIDAKLRATLNGELIQKLESKGIYKKLLN